MLASIPPWVPVILLVLLALGYRQSLPRTVRPNTLAGLALGMVGLSLYGVIAAFGPTALALVGWAVAYATAALVGSRLVSSRRMVVVGAGVQVPGSWAPMALFLGLFAAKFALGVAAGMHSAALQNVGWVATMSVLLGALSGGFGARALAVHRFASANANTSGAAFSGARAQ